MDGRTATIRGRGYPTRYPPGPRAPRIGIRSLRGAIVKARRAIHASMSIGYPLRPLAHGSPEKGFPRPLGGRQGSRQHVNNGGSVVHLDTMPRVHHGRAAEGLVLIEEPIAVATCNRNTANLQSRVFFNRHYLQLKEPKTDNKCN
jgi:hypothetical protein